MKNSILNIKDLSVYIGKKTILKNICFSISKKGQIISIIGPNGSGKSTLMRSILRWIKFFGSIFIFNNNIDTFNSSSLAKIFGFVPQNLNSKIQLTVFDSLLISIECMNRYFFTNPFSMKKKIIEVEKIIQYFNLQSIAYQSIHTLSGGQFQIVSIAQALIRNPKILILDEPTSALDLYHQLKVLEIVYNYTKKKGILTILSIHDLNLAIRFSDQIVILNKGEIISKGTPSFVINGEIIQKVYKVKSSILKNTQFNNLPFIQVTSSI